METIIPNLNEQNLAFKEEIDSIISNEVSPYVDDIEQGKMDIWDVLRGIGKYGLIGITYPKEFGGRGGTFTEELLVTEALCYQRHPLDMNRVVSIYSVMSIEAFNKTEVLRQILIL